MPRYFINLHDGDLSMTDDDGVTCKYEDAVRREAIKALALMANDALSDGDSHDFTVKVWNELGEPIYDGLLSFKRGWVGRIR